jgi:hypothetical protein
LMRIAHILVAVVMSVQVLPIRGMCMPSRTPSHPCCPQDRKTPAPDSSAVPECCLLSNLVRSEGSVAEPQDRRDTPVSSGVDLSATIPRLAPPRIVLPSLRLHSVQMLKTRGLSPLSQTCLLLI